MSITSNDYVRLLEQWLPAARRMIHVSPRNKALSYYGTGESAHWPVQSNFNVFAALAVLGTAPSLDEARAGMAGEGIIDLSLRLLRYGLSTNGSGGSTCVDGGRWGHSWISVLGLERMMHGVDALEGHLTAEDAALLRHVLISEADWILAAQPVVAGIEGSLNKPESNVWNGCFLVRAALRYPDAPRRSQYLRKATSFLLNGISVPSDARSTQDYHGKPLNKWHVGPNFTDVYSLNHHNYLNVGYMVICLSNVAMLHFDLRRRGLAVPPEVYHHAEDLWRVVRSFTFPDGRLCRTGGDTRARYCYCQDYAIPMWILANDRFGDDATPFEAGWLSTVAREMAGNPDGSFLSERLASVREHSPFYYARLESDRAVSLSYAAFWRRHFPLVPSSIRSAADTVSWSEPYHGAAFHRSRGRIASWTWKGGDGPAILCVPPGRSDMAEWHNSLYGELRTGGKLTPRQQECTHHLFDGGFSACGRLEWQEELAIGEGEKCDLLARHYTAAAALPDGHTMVVLQHAVAVRDCILREVKSLCLKMPNDVFNGGARSYGSESGTMKLGGIPPKEEVIGITSSWLSVDDALSLARIYGGDGFTVFRPAERRIAINRPTPPLLGSLYADEICLRCRIGNTCYAEGEVLIDDGFAVATGVTDDARPLPKGLRQLPCDDGLRAVRAAGRDGKAYLVVANFSTEARCRLLIPGTVRIVALSTGAAIPVRGGSAEIEIPPTSAAVYRMDAC